MRIPYFLLLVLFIIAGLSFTGCTICTIRPNVAVEPDTEWILAQYASAPEATVNKRREIEGW